MRLLIGDGYGLDMISATCFLYTIGYCMDVTIYNNNEFTELVNNCSGSTQYFKIARLCPNIMIDSANELGYRYN